MFELIDLNLTLAQAQATGGFLIGIMIVTFFAVAAYMFVRFMMWWWDQNR